MNTLYHYIHCPFCVRVRMAAGFCNTPYESKVLSYEDEKTPKDLMNKKMLPILDFGDGTLLNESLDIIKKFDSQNILTLELLENLEKLEEIEMRLKALGSPIHNLCMPYWAYSQEFTPNARQYFIDKKSQKRGPFNILMSKKDDFLSELSPLLLDLESNLNPFYRSEVLTVFDIMLASHIWGMYIFPEFQFSEKLHNYLQTVKSLCSFEYHEDYMS